jgi:hypothetical protein
MSLVLIGNSPSSGSTFLADLLDSTKYSACGEELGIFSNKHFYNFEEFKVHKKVTSKLASLYFPRTHFYKNVLPYYGLDETLFFKLVNESEGFSDFIKDFSLRYLALRGKDIEGIVFEKTPENINTAEQFLNSTKDTYFINIIRHPLYVYASMLKRGFKNNIALLNWFIEASISKKLYNNDRFITIKYEDLVEKPFETVQNIIKKIKGVEITEKEIKNGYENNDYRKYFSFKLDSWEVKDIGKIQNANNKSLDNEILFSFSKIKDLKISKNYAQKFNLEEDKLVDLMNFYKYNFEFEKFPSTEGFKFSDLELKQLKNKWKQDFKNKEASFNDKRIYLQPVEKVK